MKLAMVIRTLFAVQFACLNILFGQVIDSTNNVIPKHQCESMTHCSRVCLDTTPLNRGFLLDIGALTPRMNFNDRIGFNIDFQMYLSKKFSIGISTQQVYLSTTSDYGLVMRNPKILYLAIGIATEYNLIRRKRFEINCRILNGKVGNDLYSETINVKNEKKASKSDPDSIPLYYACNRNYFISPIINLLFILFPMKETYNCQLQLYSQVGYRQLIGKTMFGTLNEFSSPFAQIGLRLLMRNDRTYFSEWFSQKFKHKNTIKE